MLFLSVCPNFPFPKLCPQICSLSFSSLSSSPYKERETVKTLLFLLWVSTFSPLTLPPFPPCWTHIPQSAKLLEPFPLGSLSTEDSHVCTDPGGPRSVFHRGYGTGRIITFSGFQLLLKPSALSFVAYSLNQLLWRPGNSPCSCLCSRSPEFLTVSTTDTLQKAEKIQSWCDKVF